jgi:glycosyltransferase involved in cell wall biosynthesis
LTADPRAAVVGVFTPCYASSSRLWRGHAAWNSTSRAASVPVERRQLQKQDQGGKADILFVTSSLDVGGTERHLASISGVLRALGWTIVVYCTGGEGPCAEALRRDGISVIVPPRLARSGLGASLGGRAFRLPFAAFHLLRVLRKRRFAIVHFFLPEAYIVGAPLAALVRTRLLVMSRRSLNNYQRNLPLGGLIERCLHPLMSAVLANSRSVAKQLEGEGVTARRIGLIYNGVGETCWTGVGRAQLRAMLGLGEATLVLVIVANLIPYKGHLDLIEALGRVAGKMPPDWQLLAVGRDEGVGPAIKSRADTLGIAAHISLLGVRSDIHDLLRASDIAILASHQEGFSNAIIEGMQAGLPMIVTDVGGNAEAVCDGETGLVVAPRNPDALGDAILHLAGDGELRRRFGDAGRRRVKEHFSLEACVAAYEALYCGLLAGKTPGEIPQVRYKIAI